MFHQHNIVLKMNNSKLSIIHAVLVRPHPYFQAMSESGNIHLNRGPACSDAANATLCSSKNLVKSTSALITLVSNDGTKNYDTGFASRSFVSDICFEDRTCFLTSPMPPRAMLMLGYADVRRTNRAKCKITVYLQLPYNWVLNIVIAFVLLHQVLFFCQFDTFISTHFDANRNINTHSIYVF